MNELRDLAGQVYFGNTLRAWAIAFAVFVLLFTILPLARAAVRNRLRKLDPQQSKTTLEILLALIESTTRLFFFAVAAWLSTRPLFIPEDMERTLDIAVLVVTWMQVAIWGTTFVVRVVDARAHATDGAAGAASLNILRFVATIAIWSIAFLLLLANLGVEIMPLIAGLGIGGIALALAVQNVLGDLLASLSIALDKPFRVGDFLVVGEEKGTVEHIGIKSTRLRSLTGEMIVLSNSDMLKSRVRNYQPLQERRIAFTIGIVYETPREQVGKVAGLIEEAIRAQPKTRVDRVHFASFGDYALLFEAVYFVLDAEYKVFMDIQQAINLGLLEEFERRSIELAYPTARHLNVQMPAADDAG